MDTKLWVRAEGYCISALLASCLVASGQRVGQNGGPNGAASGSTGIADITGKKSPFGTAAGVNRSGGPSDQVRPLFLTGNVVFDDGTQPSSEIRIERVCSGSSHLETHTDSRGHFSFRVGGEVGNNISDADASNDSFGTARSASNGLNQTGEGLAGTSALIGCELKAAYPGYVSDRIDLSMRHSMDDPKIGTILLHHLGNVKGTTISLTTAQAPKSAMKSYEKGTQLAQKGKFEEAEQRYLSATAEDPKFAAAWFALGQVQQHLNKSENAKKSFLAAVDADNHFLSPYNQLALLSAEQGNWEDAAKYSKKAIDLNPAEFPSAFWYNAVANYHLKNEAEAEKSARALTKLDSQHKYPQAETMLSEFASNRGDLNEAAAHLRAYLAEAPSGKNTDAMRNELSRIEELRATQAKNTPATVPH